MDGPMFILLFICAITVFIVRNRHLTNLKLAYKIFSIIEQAHAGNYPQSDLFFTGGKSVDWFRQPLSSEQMDEIRSWNSVTLYHVDCDLLNVEGPTFINGLKKQKFYVALFLSVHVVGYDGHEFHSPRHEIKLDKMPVKVSFAAHDHRWEITAIEPLSSSVALEKKKFAFHESAYWAVMLAVVIYEFFIS